MTETARDHLNFRELDEHGNATGQGSSEPTEPGPRSGQGVAGPSTTDDRPAFNPFVLILWLLAPGLIIGGAGAVVYAQETLSTGTAVPQQLAFMLISFAPFAVLAGVLAVLGLLFWHAAQWQRRRPK